MTHPVSSHLSQKQTKRTLFYNARLIDPATEMDCHGGILVDHGIICEISEKYARLPEGDFGTDIRLVDCQKKILCPGFIDMRSDFCEPGAEHKETIASGTLAAVTGGVTSVACMPTTTPPVDDVSVVEFIARRAREARRCKVHPMALITRGNDGKTLTEFGLLNEAGVVALTDGHKMVSDSLVMRRALSYARAYDILLMQHPEDSSLAESGVMNEGFSATRLGLPGIPVAAEVIAISRDLRLLELTGGRLHIAHVTTAEGVDLIRRAKQRGLDVTCDTAPPYFFLNDLAVGDYRTFAKLSPPLRSEDDRLAIVEGLKEGVIDAIASDHCPQDQDAKRQTFSAAAFGGVGLETILPITLSLVHNNILPLHKALGLLTYKPADILRLPVGRLALGKSADFAILDQSRAWKITEETLNSKSKNSPFDGTPVEGRVLMTIVDGRIVHHLPEFDHLNA